MSEVYLQHHGIKGMKWGVRRYQTKDGSLTVAGQKRYERDQRENSGKKKGNKVGKADPDRWVKEDMERTRSLTNASSRIVGDIKRVNDKAIKEKPKVLLDLSDMTDQEMRSQINRALLEKQYNDIFAPQNIPKGREYVSKILDVAGDTLAITSSALAVALAIKELKG